MRASILAVLLAMAACGDPGEGDACESSNSTDECGDGLVCTGESTATVCRLLCDDAADVCPDGTTCTGISNGSHKSCQPAP